MQAGRLDEKDGWGDRLPLRVLFRIHVEVRFGVLTTCTFIEGVGRALSVSSQRLQELDTRLKRYDGR